MKYIILLVISLSLNYSFSQTNGLFGKKFIAELDFIGYNPSLYNFGQNFSNPYYKNENNQLVETKNRLDYGYRFNIGVNSTRNMAVYLEIGQEFFDVNPLNNYYSQYTNDEINGSINKMEKLQFSSFSVMPKIEFTSPDGLLPIGLYSQIGVGMNKYKIKSKSTHLVNDYDYNVSDLKEIQFLYPNSYTSKAFTVLYKLGMRVPVSNNILWNFGFRYNLTLNLDGLLNYSSGSSQVYAIDKGDLNEFVYRKEIRKILVFETGIAFAF